MLALEVLAHLAGRGVRDQQRTGAGRDHRRHDRHQPTTEGAVGVVAVAGEHDERHHEGTEQTGDRACRPQHPVQVDSQSLTQDVLAHQQRTRTHGQHRHGWGAVEVAHHRVRQVATGLHRVNHPVPGGRSEQAQQQQSGDHPDGEGDTALAGQLQRQGHRGVRHDPGAHHRGEPVRTQVLERVAGSVQLAEQPTGRAPSLGAAQGHRHGYSGCRRGSTDPSTMSVSHPGQ